MEELINPHFRRGRHWARVGLAPSRRAGPLQMVVVDLPPAWLLLPNFCIQKTLGEKTTHGHSSAPCSVPSFPSSTPVCFFLLPSLSWAEEAQCRSPHVRSPRWISVLLLLTLFNEVYCLRCIIFKGTSPTSRSPSDLQLGKGGRVLWRHIH